MEQMVVRTRTDTETILDCVDRSISGEFPTHPFTNILEIETFVELIGQYAAMSVAFPYIQSGAIYQGYRRYLDRTAKRDNIAVSAAVGAFLAWDEFGGHELILRHGAEGLLDLIDVDANFHSALLIDDVRQLIGAAFSDPSPSERTATYLDQLYEGLSDPADNRNIAHMIAFERHAFAMITGLFASIERLFGPGPAAKLRYFQAHIGSDSCGEAIHVAMTGRMIERLVGRDEEAAFVEACLSAYALNHDWCASLARRPAPVPALA